MVVFLSLAAVGLLFLLVSAFFGDHFEAHPEIEASGGGFLSVRAIAIFVTAFGVVGAIARHYEQPAAMASLWGLLSGVAMSIIYVLTMGLVKSQEASSLIEDGELVGQTGRITVAVPAGGMGEVTCTIKAQTTRRLARAARTQALPEGSVVRIAEVQADVVLVEPLS